MSRNERNGDQELRGKNEPTKIGDYEIEEPVIGLGICQPTGVKGAQ